MQAKVLPRLIESGMASTAPVTHVVVSKFAWYLPLYRQVQILAGQGLHLDRATLAGWVKRAAWWLKSLYELQLRTIQASEAINYALNHWDGLTLFLRDGRVEVDSNTVERSMRPIAMGRRNSLFSGSEAGAESWAILSLIVNTAKLHELDPQAYLSDVLERIVSGRTKSHQLHELLAWNWKAARERIAQAAA
ncbi:hypothetical protein ACVWZ6_002664 [Bradyrhizobium sp. GM6.1]